MELKGNAKGAERNGTGIKKRTKNRKTYGKTNGKPNGKLTENEQIGNKKVM